MQKPSIQTFLQTKYILTYLILGVLLVSTLLLGISIGTVSISLREIGLIVQDSLFNASLSPELEMHKNIILNIRLPRVLLAGLVGASLALVGAAFQGLLRNPLADPYTLGISSGASVGAVMTIYFGLSLPVIQTFTLPFLSVLASFVTLLVVLIFAKRIDASMRVETLILTGVIFGSFLGAVISLMIALTSDELRQIVGWLLGSVSMRGWSHVQIILPFFIVGTVILLFQAKELNAFSFGEEQAKHIGVDIAKKKLLILIAGSILTGAAVSVSGVIGFVGLVIPHLMRKISGPDHRHLLIQSLLLGASFLMLADLVSRIIIAPQELPLGVITALIGAPIFALILLKERQQGRKTK